MKGILKFLLIIPTLVSAQAAQPGDDVIELTNMLNAFLVGASINDAAAHERFWAEDLIYTSSGGERFGKDTIMNGLRSPPPEAAAPETGAGAEKETATVYSAEDLRIQQYGDAAIVAFKLVGTSTAKVSPGETTAVAGSGTSAAAQATPPEVMYYYNTGTFLRRDGVWQVVAWQATRIPEPD